MNEANVRAAIAVMQRAQSLDMVVWQSKEHGPICSTVDELHACGNTACFAGYVAMSEEFKAAGGRVSSNGSPRLGVELGHEAISKWLEISEDLADALVLGTEGCLYPVPFHEVKPHHVIDALERVLSGELK